MSMWLRYDTASQEVLLGTFVDETDGKTPETSLSIANTDIKLWKEGATSEASKNSGGATHIAAGRYYCVLDGTDTGTLGKLEINVAVSGALPVRREFMVVPQEVYDALVLNTLPKPGYGTPPSAPNVFVAIMYLFKAWKNPKSQNGSTLSIMDDSNTSIEQQASVYDDGTTVTISEVVAPP